VEIRLATAVATTDPGARGSAVVADARPGTAMSVDFERFYAGHRDGLVRALTLSLRDEQLAAEAVDEAFTRALHRWHVVGEFDHPQAWVYRTARNWATSRFRRRSRDRRFAPMIATPDRVVEDTPDPRLAGALAELDADRRNVLVLRFYLDWSVDQVADALDISPGTVKSRTHRALADLQRILGDES